MNLNDVNWIDSQLKKLTIEYDKAKLLVECDSGNYVITCTGFIGMDNLCIWDDTIVENIYVENADPSSDVYLQNVFSHYDKDFDYDFGGGRILGENILILCVSIINNIPFRLYCKGIEVSLHLTNAGSDHT